LYNGIGAARRRRSSLPLRKEVEPMELMGNILSVIANVLTIILAVLAFRKKK